MELLAQKLIADNEQPYGEGCWNTELFSQADPKYEEVNEWLYTSGSKMMGWYQVLRGWIIN